MSEAKRYEAVIGLEIHVQLATRSKIFAADKNEFGAGPNTNIGPITMAHPGTLPLVSREVFDMAMKLGFALNCEISRKMIFDRKNYFYPDLPKGYQITQDATPICKGGGLSVTSAKGHEHFISLTKIHLEEDAGKSIHVEGKPYTHVDLNRAGVPLVEIVTDPVIADSEQAALFLAEIRKLIRHLEISDGNMEEGSMRCDANVSIRKPGDPLGSKVEVKNMNSIRNVRKAIDHEIKRQEQLLTNGETIVSETRTYDPNTNTTSGMRKKEELNDYRYFPEPDISPVVIDEAWFQEVKNSMPALPNQIKSELVKKYGLPDYDAAWISDEKSHIEYFYEAIKFSKSYKSVSNWLMGVVKSYLNEQSVALDTFPIKPRQLAEVVNLVEEGIINQTSASQKLFKYLLAHPEADVHQAAADLDIVQDNDTSVVQQLIDDVLSNNPEKVKAYHNGKKGLAGMFMGEVMKKSSGSIDPKVANQLILETLAKMK